MIHESSKEKCSLYLVLHGFMRRNRSDLVFHPKQIIWDVVLGAPADQYLCLEDAELAVLRPDGLEKIEKARLSSRISADMANLMMMPAFSGWNRARISSFLSNNSYLLNLTRAQFLYEQSDQAEAAYILAEGELQVSNIFVCVC